MRTLSLLSFISLLAAAAGGCNSFDPVASCEDRCAQRQAMGCEPSSTRCDNQCVLADDFYDDGLERAQQEGCVSQYHAYVDCLVDTPPCATNEVIAEMCGEEYLILENCW